MAALDMYGSEVRPGDHLSFYFPAFGRVGLMARMVIGELVVATGLGGDLGTIVIPADKVSREKRREELDAG